MPRSLFAVLTLAALLTAPAAWAQGRWLRAESANFVIYTNEKEADARRFSAQLETFDQTLRLLNRVPLDEPVRRKLPIYLLARDADMRRIRPGIPAGVRGFYTSHLDDTYAVAIAGENNDPTLQHEYAHHFMFDHRPGGYPAWLVEGYAEYFMTFRETPQGLELGRPNDNRGSWLTRGRWLPLATVLRARPSDMRDMSQVSMFYAQSWGLTHYFLSNDARSRQLNAYVDAVGRGQPSVEAMAAATGMDSRRLSQTLEAYLKKGLTVTRFTLKDPKAPAVEVTSLPASAADVLLLSLRLKNDNGQDAAADRTDGPVLLADARKAAARHPGDALAQRVLARAEIKLGDLARAETLLQGRLAADPKDLEALQLLAQARLKAAAAAPPDQVRKLRAEAAAFAARAYKLDPDSYQTLIAAAQAREGAAGHPNENDVNVLMDALDLAPQVAVLRAKAAAALAARGRRAEAAAVIRPLAFNPHAGPAAAAARAFLATLEPADAADAAAPAQSSN